jgi:hypothetical protein
LIVLALALSASTAFLLAHRLTGAFLPALLAGYLYGFSSYQLAHVVGHLPLVFVALLPAAAHLCARRVDGELGRRAFVLALGAVFAAQFLVATKVLFSAASASGQPMSGGARSSTSGATSGSSSTTTSRSSSPTGQPAGACSGTPRAAWPFGWSEDTSGSV